jgi:hypothetical protein
MSPCLVSSTINLIITPQVPATSSRHHNLSHSTQGMREVHPAMIPSKNVSVRSSNQHSLLTSLQSRSVPAPPITQSSATASTTIRLRPRLSLSSWWPLHAGRALPLVADVPLAQGQLVRLVVYHRLRLLMHELIASRSSRCP